MSAEEKEQLNNEEVEGEEKSSPEAEEVDEETLEEDIDTESADEEGDAQLEVPTPDEPDWKDKYLRLHADWDNYRKRMDEQRADERTRANERLISDLIPLIDDMNHAISYAKENGEGSLLEGVEQISAKFTSMLEKNGLEKIDPKGEPFDPILHQAVGTVENAEVYEETVNDVYQPGYKLGKKVIRPAMVTITTGGEKRPKEELKEVNE